MQTLSSGTHPTLGTFLHALLPQVEQDVTHILSVVGNRAFLHKILATGEVLSEELNIPLLKTILQATDSLVAPAQ